jgi:hypothetical protein
MGVTAIPGRPQFHFGTADPYKWAKFPPRLIAVRAVRSCAHIRLSKIVNYLIDNLCFVMLSQLRRQGQGESGLRCRFQVEDSTLGRKVILKRVWDPWLALLAFLPPILSAKGAERMGHPTFICDLAGTVALNILLWIEPRIGLGGDLARRLSGWPIVVYP